MKGSRGFVKCWDVVIQQSRVFGPFRPVSLTHTHTQMGDARSRVEKIAWHGQRGIGHRVFVLLEG